MSPENAASLAMIAGRGFVLVGDQIDEEDGQERRPITRADTTMLCFRKQNLDRCR